MVQGSSWGYFPDPTNSILVVSLQNVPRVEAFLQGYDIQVITGRRYLRGFIGTEAVQARWLKEKVEGWRALVTIIAGVEGKHPQTSYTGL